MATAKKPATKKKPAAKAAPKAKSTSKKAPVKKTAELRSFRVSPDEKPFYSFKITKQTIYWIILVAVIVITQLWILKLQLDVVNITDALLLDAE